MYEYRVEILRVVDGDTIDARLDLGLRVEPVQRLRLAGIDAWATRGPERARGLVAKEALEGFLATGGPWIARTAKTGKYGRWLAQIVNRQGDDVCRWMVEEGHAIERVY